MLVTWWMPGTAAGKLKIILVPPHRGGRSGGGFGSLLFDPRPDLGSHGFACLFLQARHQPDRPRHDPEAAAHLPREPELAADGPHRAGPVDGHLPPHAPPPLPPPHPHHLPIPPPNPS